MKEKLYEEIVKFKEMFHHFEGDLCNNIQKNIEILLNELREDEEAQIACLLVLSAGSFNDIWTDTNTGNTRAESFFMPTTKNCLEDYEIIVNRFQKGETIWGIGYDSNGYIIDIPLYKKELEGE